VAQRGLQVNGCWDDEWEAAWELQPQLASMHYTAALANGQVVTSARYQRNRSRNGSRVLLAFETRGGQQRYAAAEVQYYLQLRQPAPTGAGDGASGGSSRSAGCSGGEKCVAVIICYKTRQPRNEPDLATILLEAKHDDWERDSFGHVQLRAVPLDLIIAPLHTHTRRSAGQTMLSFVPVMGRSRRVVCRDAVV
jgi:hypothetical protein